jgi:hypothetical protein
VPSLDDALRDLLVQPVQQPFRRLLAGGRLSRLPAHAHGDGAGELYEGVAALVRGVRDLLRLPGQADGDVIAGTLVEDLLVGLSAVRGLDAVRMPATATGARPAPADGPSRPATAATEKTVRVADASPAGAAATTDETMPAIADAATTRVAVNVSPILETLASTWLLLHLLPPAVGQTADSRRGRAWIDEWRLAPVIADAFRDAGAPEADAWRSVDAVKALLTLPAWPIDRPLGERVMAIMGAWLADESVARVLQVNVHRDVRWFNKEAFEMFAGWAAAVEAIRSALARASSAPDRRTGAEGRLPSERAATDAGEAVGAAEMAEIRATVNALVAAAAESGYRLDALPAGSPGPREAETPSPTG